MCWGTKRQTTNQSPSLDRASAKSKSQHSLDGSEEIARRGNTLYFAARATHVVERTLLAIAQGGLVLICLRAEQMHCI